MHANRRERIEKTGAGDIVAVTGLKSCFTGDSICDPSHPILLELSEPTRRSFPSPSRSKPGRTRKSSWTAWSSCPRRIPTFKYEENPDTGQTIISGMGELHLEIVLSRLERDYHVGVNAGKPQVVYRETITEKSRAKGVFDREIGGVRHFGEVDVHLAPRDRGAGNVVSVRIRDGSIPESFHQAVEEGIWDAIASGPIMGYPMVDVEVVVYGGSCLEGVSSELAFRVAAAMAFKNACELGVPLLLEPYMSVEILVPEEYLGEVIGDVNTRKGRVESITSRAAIQVVRAVVPLSRDVRIFHGLEVLHPGEGHFHHALLTL